MDSQLLDHTGLILGAGLAALALWYWTQPSVPLPPGPRGNLIFGSALELRHSKTFWLSFAKYSKIYGPLITIRMMMSRKIIILSDPKLVTELFEKRATQYSDRRVGEMTKLVGFENHLLYLNYGTMLKQYRTLLQRAFNNRVVVDYLPLQEHEVKRMMRRLQETPERFMQHIHLMAASVAIRMAYGYDVDSQDDPLVKSVEKVMSILADLGTPGRWMVDTVPVLKYLPSWFPGAGFHRLAESWAPIIQWSRDEPFEFTKRQIAAGTAEPSFVSKLLNPENGEVTAEQEDHIKSVASALYGAASDTTVSAVKSFFLAMTLYPDVQSKAQAEIAAYIQAEADGPDVANKSQVTSRFITMADRPHLPYTCALIRELLRWHPIVPIIGHKSAGKDDNNVICNGKTYTIPAYTPVIVNVWQILHDPEVYPEPEKFMPERFLVSDPPPNPEVYVFGFGRRACPGMHAAQQSMWLSISNLLSAFNVTKAKDDNGEYIVPEERYTSEIISHPFPFECNIQPREGCGEWLKELDNSL